MIHYLSTRLSAWSLYQHENYTNYSTSSTSMEKEGPNDKLRDPKGTKLELRWGALSRPNAATRPAELVSEATGARPSRPGLHCMGALHFAFVRPPPLGEIDKSVFERLLNYQKHFYLFTSRRLEGLRADGFDLLFFLSSSHTSRYPRWQSHPGILVFRLEIAQTPPKLRIPTGHRAACEGHERRRP